MTRLAPGLYDPAPTKLDRAVLERVPLDRPGRRAAAIASAINGRRAPWSPAGTDVAEVRAILRGFEHLGHVECRSGWWTRA